MKWLFTIPFAALIRWHTPRIYYLQWWRDLIESYTAGVRLIKEDLLVYRSAHQKLLNYNGTKIYLERYLNDLYDPIIKGIYIEKVARIDAVYWYNEEENRDVFVYNKYDDEIDYVVGEFCDDDGIVYRCIQASTGNQPSLSAAYFEEEETSTYYFNKTEEANELHYRVMIPEYINLTASLRRKIKGSVDTFNLATANYEIKKV